MGCTGSRRRAEAPAARPNLGIFIYFSFFRTLGLLLAALFFKLGIGAPARDRSSQAVASRRADSHPFGSKVNDGDHGICWDGGDGYYGKLMSLGLGSGGWVGGTTLMAASFSLSLIIGGVSGVWQPSCASLDIRRLHTASPAAMSEPRVDAEGWGKEVDDAGKRGKAQQERKRPSIRVSASASPVPRLSTVVTAVVFSFCDLIARMTGAIGSAIVGSLRRNADLLACSAGSGSAAPRKEGCLGNSLVVVRGLVFASRASFGRSVFVWP